MSVRTKILTACLIFVAIVAAVGGLAQRQSAEMGRLAIGIYDRAFMGMSYVDQAEEAFLHLEAAANTSGSVDPARLRKILDLIDVALDRAASDQTRKIGAQSRDAVGALLNASNADLPDRLTKADASLAKLVRRFAAD